MTDTAHVEVESAVRRRPPWVTRRAVPEWLVVLAALGLALVVTGAVLQVAHPFIRHDDWPFTLARREPGSAAQFSRNLYEGRWLNTVYWYVIGQRTSIVVASTVFVVAYSAFVWGFVRALAPPNRLSTFVLTFAVFVSAIWVRLVYWPGTLSASMIVAATAVWTLPWARRRRWTLAVWMLLSVVLAVLSYPPVAALVFLTFVVTELDRSVRRLLVGAAGFVAAYGVGILTVYAFNWLAFGTFGLTISAWRRPNPLESLDDLVTNLARYGTQFASLMGLLGWAAVVAVVCLVWALVDASTRRAAVVVLGAVLLVVGLEAGLTIYSGVVTGTRASLWAWPAVCLPAALLLKGIRPSRIAGVVALAIIAVVGVLSWRTDLGEHRATRDQYDVIVSDTAAVVGQHPDDAVVMWMEPRWKATAQGTMTAVTVRSMLYDQQGLYPRWCAPAECAAIARAVQQDPHADVLRVDGLTVVRIPRPPAWL
ncbi:hypothetical protein LJR027_000029 [Terrabacter sp. LjRoot27]|uniref:hypothetical protein n=1 Tax=Terrabacter sp. LjRoot27 TaxID=3342306 RepID=UPI003ECDB996